MCKVKISKRSLWSSLLKFWVSNEKYIGVKRYKSNLIKKSKIIKKKNFHNHTFK